MKINRNSWHYRLWYNSFSESTWGAPARIDLCRYCHRIFWVILGKILGVAIGLVMLGGLGYAFYHAFILNFLTSMKIMGVIAVVLFLPLSYAVWLNRWEHGSETKSKTLVGKWFQTRKNRVCPLVEFTDE